MREMDREREALILAGGRLKARSSQHLPRTTAMKREEKKKKQQKKISAYHLFILLASKQDSNMAMKCFHCLLVLDACLSEYE